MDTSNASQSVLTAPSHPPPSRLGYSDAELQLLVQRYQDYHDHRRAQAQLEHEVSQMRSHISTTVHDIFSDDSRQGRNSHHSGRPMHDRSSLLRARYSERTPSVNRESSTGSNSGSQSLRRPLQIESRRIKANFVIDPVLQVPCFAITLRSAQAAGMPEVELVAINFILALEFPCWEHFRCEDFYHNCRHSQSSSSRRESGHLMTASALCLTAASCAVFSVLDEVADSGTAHDYLGVQGRTLVSWEGSGISYKALRSMARPTNANSTGNTRSNLELTPTQAWFELESRLVRPQGGRSAATGTGTGELCADHALVDRLKQQLSRIVSCSHFGTTMRRVDFEDVVADVLRGGH
ncbi:hypothetical protein BROUX41_005763 [Berkeleyomyces rouxiae]|uniref:uncharacterized protein n=1 Tax=Berkeleyomyces rouxiae TaxID=2035830 RepID=UPI003B792FD9